MKNIRIISRLDVKGPNLVKGIHLEGLRVLGNPAYFASKYYDEGIDEIVYMDTVASLYGRNNLRDIAERTTQDVFIPVSVGGGIRSVADAKAILSTGCEKVCLNTAAIQRPALISELASALGSQSVCINVEAKKRDGWYECLCDNAREKTGKNAMEWAQEAVMLGAGEILLTSVDNEGTGRGFDIGLTRAIADAVPVHVVAHGGCGCPNDVLDVVTKGHADAVCISGMFHYHYHYHYKVHFKTESEGVTDFMQGKRSGVPSGLDPCGIGELKRFLHDNNVNVRIEI